MAGMAGIDLIGTGQGSGEPARWSHTWRDLVREVVDQGRCTGCSGCILACPRNVLTLDWESWTPQLMSEAWFGDTGDDCVHSERGCTMCTRACPRFDAWEEDSDLAAHGRRRQPDEVLGIHRDILLVNATDDHIARAGQDGGLATAMLTYALEHDIIDAALVSYTDRGQAVRPGVARTRDELLAAAGSRYTYSPNTLAWTEAAALDGVDRLGIASVGCQVSVPAVSAQRGARKVARRFALTIGLLCSKTFDASIYADLVEAEYGIRRDDIVKVNIKGKFQVWTSSPDGDADLEIPLKECQPFQRAGCDQCPDFTAQHADISLGGIGRYRNTTLTIVRSTLAEDLIRGMEGDGWITTRSAAEHDPGAVELVGKMSARQRKRWKVTLDGSGGDGAPGSGGA